MMISLRVKKRNLNKQLIHLLTVEDISNLMKKLAAGVLKRFTKVELQSHELNIFINLNF